MAKKKKPIKLKYKHEPNKEVLDRGFKFLAENFKRNYDKIQKEANKGRKNQSKGQK